MARHLQNWSDFKRATTHNLYILWRHRLEALLKYNVISQTQWVDINEKNAQEGGDCCDIFEHSFVLDSEGASPIYSMCHIEFEVSNFTYQIVGIISGP